MRLSRAVLRERWPGYVGQFLLLAVVAWLVWIGAGNFAANLRQLHIGSGFGFLAERAGFDVAQALLPFGPSSSYLDAVAVATINTALVVVLASALATLLALPIAFGRLSEQPLVRAVCSTWVEVFRNVPLLLQIFFWYFSAVALLPSVADSLDFAGVLLNNRGLFLPWPHLAAGSIVLERPVAAGFNVSGGIVLLPELVALTLGLAIYNSAFLAEIFRAGIQSVPRGQSEAAMSVGLSGPRAAWFVILPQALRLALPPAAGQYQSLAKASSLAAAIGYPDIMQMIGGTVLSQTSQALEAMTLVIVLYAALNMLIALLTSLANFRLLRGRVR